MSGKKLIERFNDGFKIGSLSDPSRPIALNDLIIVEDVSETNPTESGRIGTVNSLLTDGLGAIGKNGMFAFAAQDTIFAVEFQNGVMTYCEEIIGNGNQYNPYLIDTPQKLNAMRYKMNAYWKLTADIDLYGYNWLPIGTSVYPFNGHFNGDNHEIKNLYCNMLNSGKIEERAGLFGAIEGANIANVKILDAEITAGVDVGIAGILSAYCLSTNTINNCHSSGTVIANFSYGGGLIGADNGTSTITNSSSIADVVADMAGGIIGFSGGTVERCFAGGKVTGTTYGGGLIGYSNESIIRNCYAIGKVEINDVNAQAGGLIGCIYDSGGQEVTNCYSCGEVSTDADKFGGLIGFDELGMFSGCTSSYFDITVNLLCPTPNYGALGKTTDELTIHKVSTLVGWDGKIWRLVNDTNYPTLLWQ